MENITAICPECHKEWPLPKDWVIRTKVAKHWKEKGQTYIHKCANCCPALKKINLKIREVMS